MDALLCLNELLNESTSIVLKSIKYVQNMGLFFATRLGVIMGNNRQKQLFCGCYNLFYNRFRFRGVTFRLRLVDHCSVLSAKFLVFYSMSFIKTK